MSDGYGYGWGGYSYGSGEFSCYGGESGGAYYNQWSQAGYWGSGSYGSGFAPYDGLDYGASASAVDGIYNSVGDTGGYVTNQNVVDDNTSDGLQEVTVSATRLPEDPGVQSVTVIASRLPDAGAGLYIENWGSSSTVTAYLPQSTGGGSSAQTLPNTLAPPPCVQDNNGAAKGSAAYYQNASASQDPARVGIQASGNYVTFYVDQTAIGGLGHVSFALNGSAPLGVNTTNQWGAAVGAMMGISVSGYASIGDDNLTHGAAVTAITVAISPSQASAIQNYAASLESESESGSMSYNLLTNNCTEAAMQVANLAGITDPTSSMYSPLDLIPNEFISDLAANLFLSSPSRILSATAFTDNC